MSESLTTSENAEFLLGRPSLLTGEYTGFNHHTDVLSTELRMVRCLHTAAAVIDCNFTCLASDTGAIPVLAAELQPGKRIGTSFPELLIALQRFSLDTEDDLFCSELSLEVNSNELLINYRINRSPLSPNLLVAFDIVHEDVVGKSVSTKVSDKPGVFHHGPTFEQNAYVGIFRIDLETPVSLSKTPEQMVEMLLNLGIVSDCNTVFARELGFESVAAIIGQRLRDIILPGLSSAVELCRQLISSNFRIKDVELSRIDRHGNILYSANTITGHIQNNTLVRLYGSLRNITLQKQSENILLHYAEVMSNISEAVISTDLDYNIISWNRSAEEYYGYSYEEVRGKNFRKTIQLNYLSGSRESVMAELLEKGSYYGEAYFINPKGEKKFITLSISTLINNRGDKIGYVAVHKDITGRMKSDENLRISEQRYRSLVDALGEGIVMMDKYGNFVANNSSIQRIFGEDLATFSDPAARPVFYNEDGSPLDDENHPIYKTAQTGESIKGAIMAFNRRSGEQCLISVNCEPIYYSTDRSQPPDAVVATIIDVTQARAISKALAERDLQLEAYNNRLTTILDSITHGFIAIDNEMKIILWNNAIEQVTGICFEDVLGKNVQEVLPDFIHDDIYRKLKEARLAQRTTVTEMYNCQREMWIEASAYPSAEGLFIYLRDVSIRKKQEQVLRIEKTVLEYSAAHEVTLQQSIKFFLRNLEDIFRGLTGSVVMQSGMRTSVISSPGFSADITEYLGVADLEKNIQHLSDLPDSPLENERYKQSQPIEFNLALQHVKTAEELTCYSFPVWNATHVVIATLVTCVGKNRGLSDSERDMLEKTSKVLGTIISGKLAEQKLRISNERYLLVTRATNDAVYDWDMENGKLHWGDVFYSLFGYSEIPATATYETWENNIHPDDREEVKTKLFNFVTAGRKNLWSEEYRFRDAQGNYRIVQDRGFLVYNQHGEVTRMVGSVQDITDMRVLQQQLLSQELEKQKLVAQAVVEAQEKERGDIGKELHDNVNQILSTARLYLELARTEESQRFTLIERSSATILSAINELRSISRSLVPGSIIDLGIIESVNDLVENIRFTQQLEVNFNYADAVENRLTRQQKLMLFRIIQEQVNNVLKHSKAQNLDLELGITTKQVWLEIIDDGIGFDKNNIKNKKGVGLNNITSRAELFNGTVRIDSSPENGCKLRVEVPISI